MKQVWVNLATCSRTRSVTRGALLPTETTAMPEPKSMSELPSASTSTPPPAAVMNTGRMLLTPRATARSRRASSSREAGPGISVTRRRRWGSSGPPVAGGFVVIVPTIRHRPPDGPARPGSGGGPIGARRAGWRAEGRLACRRPPPPGTILPMVIPVHDINPLRRTPWVTYGLIAANVAVLLFTPGTLPGTASSAAVACRQQAFDDRFGAIPHELITGRPLRLVPTGREVPTAQGPACVIARPAYGKSPPLSVLTAMFVHAGWLHLLGNMLFLLIFGNNIEDRFRKVPYLIFYLACGYIAAYGFALIHPGSVAPLVGASGAIAGVLGAYLALYPKARVWSLVPFLFFIPLRIPAWIVLGLWFVLQWAYSFGFPAGLLVGLVVRASSSQPPVSS